MRRKSLEILACPHCLGSLEPSHGGDNHLDGGTLRCAQEGFEFPVIDGIPHLIRLDRVAWAESFGGRYSLAWQRDGWGCADPDYLLNLPYRDLTRRQAGKWRVKARSMKALFRVLDEAPPGRTVDLGCGPGWLSYRLAQRGHEVYAVDIVRDDVLGLRAAGVYLRGGTYFERVWGELARPPFLDGSVDCVVCNASLHYASDPVAALAEISRILRPGGILCILNSPVHRDAKSAMRAQTDFRERLRHLGASEEVTSSYHHFTRGPLLDDIRHSLGPARDVPFEPGRFFRWTRRAKGLLLGMELASFPVLAARRPEPEDVLVATAAADPPGRG